MVGQCGQLLVGLNSSLGPSNSSDFSTQHLKTITGLLMLTVCVGVPLNLWALLAVWRALRGGVPGRRKPPSRFAAYVFSLLTSDVLFLILQGAHTLLLSVGHFSASLPGLMALRCLVVACHDASAYVLAWLSLERALAVAFPLWWRLFRARRVAPMACLVLWAFSLGLGALYGLARSLRQQRAQRWIIGLDFGLAFALPLVVFTVANAYVCVRGRVGGGRAPRVLAAILANAALFLCCWVPYNVLVLVYYQALWARQPGLCAGAYITAFYSVALLHLKCSLAPLLYLLPRKRLGSPLPRSFTAIFQRRPSEESTMSSFRAPSLADRAPSLADRAPSLADRAPSLADRAPSLADRAPSLADRAPSLADRAPSLADRAPSSRSEATACR